MKPLISIVIPNYNCEKYLPKCLDSLVNQTLKQIEIIIVDDCSTDGSLAIIEKYCKADSRIKFIKYEFNKSQSQARKDGVTYSNGEYIMFLDSDDYLETNACEELYSRINADGADILCFGTNVIRENPQIAQNRYESLQKWLNSSDKDKYYKDEIFDACFLKRSLPFTLWNKIYKSEICKLGLKEVSDGYFPKGQDVYAFFCIAKFAESLSVIKQQYYNYRFGSGIAGSTILDIEKFKKISLQGKIISELYKKNSKDSRHYKYIEQLELSLCKEITSKWCNQVSENESGEAFSYLIKNFSPRPVIKLLLDKYLYKHGELARKVFYEVKDDSCIDKTSINPHVAIFYHRASFGGVQRVIRDQINFLLNKGYRITLILEEKVDQNNGYLIDERVNLVYVDRSTPYNKQNADKHLTSFDEVLHNINPKIDVMIYHAGSSANLLWDLILLKAHKIKSIVVHHESFSYYMMQPMNYGIDRHEVFRLADRLVTLTKVAQAYYRLYGIRSTFIPNKVPRVNYDELASYNKNKILCVGRLDDSVKQYYETLRIISRIKKSCPDVKLHLVGSFNNKSNQSNFIEFAKKNGVFENLVFEGAHSDVGSFYTSSTCLLVTSISEGFSLVIAEAKAHGLPIIAYDLPYLDLIRDDLGVIRVEQGNADAAARSFIALNDNPALWQTKHTECITSIDKFHDIDIEDEWTSVIKSVQLGKYENAPIDYDCLPIIQKSLMFSHSQLVKKYKQLESKTKITQKVIEIVDKKSSNNKILEIFKEKIKKIFG